MENRTKSGKFVKGVSGNPSGRPKQQSAIIREQLAKHGAGVVEKVLDKALNEGDTTALKMILDRISPPLKPMSAPTVFNLSGGTLTEKANQILSATSGGEITTETASALITALGNMARIAELDELTKRIEQLEQAQGGINEL